MNLMFISVNIVLTDIFNKILLLINFCSFCYFKNTVKDNQVVCNIVCALFLRSKLIASDSKELFAFPSCSLFTFIQMLAVYLLA